MMGRKELPQTLAVLRGRHMRVWLGTLVLLLLGGAVLVLVYVLVGGGGIMEHNLDERETLRGRLTQAMFRQIAFPATDALVAFVPEGGSSQTEIKATVDAAGEGRWYPVPGGWRVKCPYAGQKFDERFFTIETGGWDHGHCDICSATINAGESCRVSDDKDRYIICEKCFAGLKRD
jgi:hypothetical protein